MMISEKLSVQAAVDAGYLLLLSHGKKSMSEENIL